MSYSEVQSKNQQIQQEIDRLILEQLAEYLLSLVMSVIPGVVWPGWGTGKRVDETVIEDFSGLSDAEIKQWSAYVAAEYPNEGGGPG